MAGDGVSDTEIKRDDTGTIMPEPRYAKPNEVINAEVLQGGYKADNGKEQMSLIPPSFLLALGALFTIGAKKYSPFNWYLGMKFSRVYDAMMRHALKFWDGEENDQVDGQHHLISVAWCACVLYVYSFVQPEKFKAFDDRLMNITDEQIRASVKTTATK